MSETTPNLGIPLPGALITSRRLTDIQAVKSALIAIDTNLAALFGDTDSITEAEANTLIAAAITSLKGGVSTDGDTLAKLRTLITNLDNLLDTVDSRSSANSAGLTSIQAALNVVTLQSGENEAAIDAIQAVLASDDTTLDTIQEIINRVKANEADLGSVVSVTGANNTVTQTMTNKTISAGVFTNGYQEESSESNVSGQVYPDLANGSFQMLTLVGATVLNMPSSAVPGKGLTLILKMGAGGGHTVTWTGVTWENGAAPAMDLAVGKRMKLTFSSVGDTWLGSVAGTNY